MPAARFWRLTINAVSQSTACAFSEVAFINAAFDDISTGGTAYASSTNGGFVPANAFDKNISTSWTSTSLPAAIWYDHGFAVDVVGVRTRGDAAATYPTGPQTLSIAYSDDGISWSSEQKLRLDGRGTFAIGEYTDSVAWDGIIADIDQLTAAPFAESQIAPAPIDTLLVGTVTPWRDMEFSGNGFIAGTVKRDADPVDMPLRRRVRLHREVDGLMARETWSDATTGAYRFDGINEAYKYTVITYDHLHDYRAVVADNLTPELMP